jgi:type IV pilus assembly protein PilV
MTSNKNSGIAMIEALVALLVLALGVLGMAGLQTRTVSETRTTNARSVAIQLTEDLAERIRLNAGVMFANPSPYVVAFGANPAPPRNCNAVNCNPAELAAFDINQWKNTVAASLPGGDAQIYWSPADPTQFGVLMAWRANISRQANADRAAYMAPIEVNTRVAGADCPPDLICHLVMLRP